MQQANTVLILVCKNIKLTLLGQLNQILNDLNRMLSQHLVSRELGKKYMMNAPGSISVQNGINGEGKYYDDKINLAMLSWVTSSHVATQ